MTNMNPIPTPQPYSILEYSPTVTEIIKEVLRQNALILDTNKQLLAQLTNPLVVVNND